MLVVNSVRCSLRLSGTLPLRIHQLRGQPAFAAMENRHLSSALSPTVPQSPAGDKADPQKIPSISRVHVGP